MTDEQRATILSLRGMAEARGIPVEIESAGAFLPDVLAVVATRPDGIRVSALVGTDGSATPWDRHDAPAA